MIEAILAIGGIYLKILLGAGVAGVLLIAWVVIDKGIGWVIEMFREGINASWSEWDDNDPHW